MQSSAKRVYRGALLLTGVAAIALGFYCYAQLSQPSTTQPSTKLHRSNATHGRRRRRIQQPSRPTRDISNPLLTALEHLAQAEESGQGFGLFDDRTYLDDELISRHGDSFILLPSRLDYIRETISTHLHLSEEDSEELRSIILSMFMNNFIKAAFPQGYHIAGDIATLQQELSPMIDPAHLKEYMDTYYPLTGSQTGGPLMEAPATNLPLPSVENMAQALSAENDIGYTDSYERWNHAESHEEGHQVLDLLYRIGEEQAKRDGYQHRGVQCNGCGMQPITGIRYHCANCWDYDLCEMCEAQQIHLKTHVFYKIRIPAPTRGQIKLVQPKWYPGEPNACPESIPGQLRESLLGSTKLSHQELDAFYDQFKCIAGKTYADDLTGIGMAIDRSGFDKYFTSTTSDRAPTPNLIYDRIFSFYDSDGDGLISFAEYAKGMAELAYNKSREARVQRLFKAFDLDGDGYVERRDFLHLLRAHYSLSKEGAHEMIYAREDALLTDEEIQEVIHGNNPISAAFGGSSFVGHQSRHGVGKHVDTNGDYVFDENVSEVLKEDSQMIGNRAQAIARQASEGRLFLRARDLAGGEPSRDAPIMDGYYEHPSPSMLRRFEPDECETSGEQGDEDVDHLGHLQDDRWPNDHTAQEDVIEALGTNVSLEDIMDPMDRRRVLYAQRERVWNELESNNLETERTAVEERWQRRQFYLDEEEGLRPPAAYQEADSSDEEQYQLQNGAKQSAAGPSARRPSLRSRSSSKVRFEDSAMHSEIETKSDVSSRNTPLNERWGGFDFSQPNRDVGVDIIYEAVQEAFNDMLNHFFKEQEDRCLAAKATRAERRKYQSELAAYEESLAAVAEKKRNALLEADMERTNALLGLSATGTSAETAIKENPSPKQDEDIPSSEIVLNSMTSNGHSKVPEILDKGAASPDPTLPQNRPNEDTMLLCGTTDSPQPVAPHITPLLLSLWHEHNLIDAEARARHGYGRLNIREFKRKLRDENIDDIDVGAEGEDDELYWEAKADLGKWSFLSSWIEMGSF